MQQQRSDSEAAADRLVDVINKVEARRAHAIVVVQLNDAAIVIVQARHANSIEIDPCNGATIHVHGLDVQCHQDDHQYVVGM